MLSRLLTTVYGNVLHFMETHMLDCPTRKYLHMQCPGCGFQRSTIALLRGELVNSFTLYPATVPILVLLTYLLLHLKYKFKGGALVVQRIYLFCVLVIVINYTYKIAMHQVFI